jgi:exonuclease V gamma subunit
MSIAGVKLVGRVGELRDDMRLVVSVSKAKSKGGRERLRSWIRHLVLRVQAGPDVPDRTLLCMSGVDAVAQFRFDHQVTPDAARDHLGRLIEGYQVGQLEPLRFHPRLAAAALRKGSRSTPHSRATGEFGDLVKFEADREAMYDRMVGGIDGFLSEVSPFGGQGADLVTLATEIMQPVLDAEGGAA